VDIAIDRDLQRWYPLIPHPVQLALVNELKRFKVVPAGRRSGKTERAKRFIVREAMVNAGRRYFVAAPTRDQVKQIYWADLKRLSFQSIWDRRPSESELTIFFPNETTIHLIGLDKPERFEGIIWDGGIVDEIADVKPDAWQTSISPALDTVNPERPNDRAWCWLIGVPDGLNHFYDLAEYARAADDPDWAFYTWPSSDILPKDVVEAAKRRMSPKQFRQEYEASFETASGRVYEDYGRLNETSDLLQPHEQIMWTHDFNFTPLSSAICARRNNDLYILDEIVLESAVARQSAMEFVERYKGHENKKIIVYGDPAGRAGEKHGHNSDYIEIEKVLRAEGWDVKRKVKPAAPAIRDRQNAVRAKIQNAAGDVSLFVNPGQAPMAHKGLSNVQIKKGSTFLEEDSEIQHITTAIGYCVDYEWPTVERKTHKAKPGPTIGRYN
jgi:hypothetical protein